MFPMSGHRLTAHLGAALRRFPSPTSVLGPIERKEILMLEITIALIAGFAAGYGVREWVSHVAKRRSVGGMIGIESYGG